MFTGIVEARGVVREKTPHSLTVGCPVNPWEDPIKIGESIAVNGCCLTVVSAIDGLQFDLSEETWRRSALGSLALGSPVNLERSLRPMDRLGGHFVQGHVDGVGELVSRNPEVLRFRVPQEGAKYLAPKGSIAIDGVSLTIVEPIDNEFEVWIIPHTLEVTNLEYLKPGSRVNVEFDMLAKYMERLLEGRTPPES